MKRIFILFAVSLIGILGLNTVKAQFIRDNAFNLPMIGGEVAFIQNDTFPNLYTEDIQPIVQSWLDKHYATAKYAKKQDGEDVLEANVQFKIDDQYIQAPLYYEGTLTIKWKDEVIQVLLDKLSFVPGQLNGKSKKKAATDVSFTVKEQVRSGADKHYPHTWDSLNEYAHNLFEDFHIYVSTVQANKL